MLEIITALLLSLLVGTSGGKATEPKGNTKTTKMNTTYSTSTPPTDTTTTNYGGSGTWDDKN